MLEQKEEIFGTGRGRTLLETASRKTHIAIEQIRSRYYTPQYEINNAHVEATFASLGWKRKTIDQFWAVFCLINTSLDGEISKDEGM